MAGWGWGWGWGGPAQAAGWHRDPGALSTAQDTVTPLNPSAAPEVILTGCFTDEEVEAQGGSTARTRTGPAGLEPVLPTPAPRV